MTECQKEMFRSSMHKYIKIIPEDSFRTIYGFKCIMTCKGVVKYGACGVGEKQYGNRHLTKRIRVEIVKEICKDCEVCECKK